ncbi:MAG: cobyric acid synthase [Desulfobacterota bacterium]|nr:cobyric acid synthase [Thermodesulfobacteriota bacterium]
MARALMICGTGSESGKSVLVTALCRLLARRGIRVAPFKAQNMALNSGVTPEGGEMGRAQIVQAEAAGIPPHVDMNPVLLKPVGEHGSQVVVHGKVIGTMDAATYYATKQTLWNAVTESYARLSRNYDVIVLEGAGSPVEMNLKHTDIVNMAMAEYADAAVVLVADIDRGGVFASIIGTLELLTPHERRRIVGFIINKFRGDMSLFHDGLRFITTRTGKPVFGMVPYIKDLAIPGEDSVALDRAALYTCDGNGLLKVGIIRLPHIANYTDFDPLFADPRFAPHYVMSPHQITWCDICIIPGSKHVAADLLYLQKRGFSTALSHYHQRGGRIVGICGGYQILGHEIKDPHRVESEINIVTGLGLLDVTTTMHTEKTTQPVRCSIQLPGTQQCCDVTGYEIHMGITVPKKGATVAFLTPDPGAQHVAGVARPDGTVWGTYVHGLFEHDGLRDAFFQWGRGGRTVQEHAGTFSYRQFKEQQYNSLADIVDRHVAVDRILKYVIAV